MKLLLPMLISVATLAGCATTEKFNAKMNSFLGQPEAVIVGRYGAPKSVYQVDALTKVLTYRRSGAVPVGGGTTMQAVTSQDRGSVYGPRGTATYSGTSTTWVPVQQPAYSVEFWCEVHFTIKEGAVSAWNAEGNHCVSDG
jgi:hypothetical protein